MKINFFRTHQINSIAFKQEINSQKPSKLWIEGEDKFVRSANQIENKPDEKTIITKADLDKNFSELSLAELNRIFEEVYPEVTKFNLNFNPIFQKLKIEKPTIKVEDFINANMRACYSFAENTISFSKQLLEEDLFLLCKKDENNRPKHFLGFCTESRLEEEAETLSKEEGEIDVVKLTDKEKEFYICSLLAHEIRHVLQAHTVASTDECIEEFKDSLRANTDLISILKSQMKKSYNDLLKDMEKMKKEGQEITPEMLQLVEECKPDEDKDYSYGLDYTPKEVLPSDSKIKFSVLMQDKRELSVKEDLLPAEILKLIDDKGAGYKALSYICNLLEIDAFNHQFEFILSNSPEDNSEMRKEVLSGMAIEAKKNSALGIDLLELLNKLPEGMKK